MIDRISNRRSKALLKRELRNKAKEEGGGDGGLVRGASCLTTLLKNTMIFVNVKHEQNQ